MMFLYNSFTVILYVFLLYIVFDFSMLQAKIFYGLFCSFTNYVVYLIPPFQVRYCCYCCRSYSFGLWWKNLNVLFSCRLIFPLDYPLDRFHNVIYFNMIFIWFYGTIYVIFILRYIDVDLYSSYPKKDMW